ncbi:ABATE domain-containing protein [Nonomuraea sp. B12E4]|uniref:CGNR zinc finger domain-containing protein n=1 Tax=Nonomuraea sp. B12E4 TaxID=3153564 RepID=UPI00325C378B
MEAPTFRLDNEHLSFRFTATLSDRYGEPVERLPTPKRLNDWLDANSLRLGKEQTTDQDLVLACQLREAIHRAGTAVVGGDVPQRADIGLINRLSRESRTYPQLTASGAHWCSWSRHPIHAALGLIAQHAIAILGGDERSQVKVCKNPECGGLYVDTSRGQNRRWCSMNICGNRAKKAKFRRADAQTPAHP